MRQDEIIQRVVESLPEYWVGVDVDRTVDGHTSLAVLRDDAGVSIAWGVEHMEGQAWDEPWSHAFPDKRIYGYYADIRWHGQPVYRALLLSVDGGRAYLPQARP